MGQGQEEQEEKEPEIERIVITGTERLTYHEMCLLIADEGNHLLENLRSGIISAMPMILEEVWKSRCCGVSEKKLHMLTGLPYDVIRNCLIKAIKMGTVKTRSITAGSGPRRFYSASAELDYP